MRLNRKDRRRKQMLDYSPAEKVEVSHYKDRRLSLAPDQVVPGLRDGRRIAYDKYEDPEYWAEQNLIQEEEDHELDMFYLYEYE